MLDLSTYFYKLTYLELGETILAGKGEVSRTCWRCFALACWAGS